MTSLMENPSAALTDASSIVVQSEKAKHSGPFSWLTQPSSKEMGKFTDSITQNRDKMIAWIREIGGAQGDILKKWSNFRAAISEIPHKDNALSRDENDSVINLSKSANETIEKLAQWRINSQDSESSPLGQFNNLQEECVDASLQSAIALIALEIGETANKDGITPEKIANATNGMIVDMINNMLSQEGVTQETHIQHAQAWLQAFGKYKWEEGHTGEHTTVNFNLEMSKLINEYAREAQRENASARRNNHRAFVEANQFAAQTTATSGMSAEEQARRIAPNALQAREATDYGDMADEDEMQAGVLKDFVNGLRKIKNTPNLIERAQVAFGISRKIAELYYSGSL